MTLIEAKPDPRTSARWRKADLTALVTGLLCLLSLTLSPVHARQAMQVDGELPAELTGQLRAMVSTSADDGDRSLPSASVSRRMVALLRSEGFYGAAVRTTVRQGEALYIVVPSERFVVESVEIIAKTDGRAAEVVEPALDALQPGSSLRAAAVMASEAAGLARIQEAGWPDAETGEREVVVDHDTRNAAIMLAYETGAFSRYGETMPEGDHWRPRFVQRLGDLPEGEIARLSALREYQARLTALDSVARAQVQLAPPGRGVEERDVLVSLTPAPRHVVEGGFAISTSEGAGVDGQWTRRNVFGGDETLSVAALLSTLEQSLETRLTAPHWRRLDQTLSFLAAARNEETDAFDQREVELEVDVTRQLNASWTVGVATGIDSSQIRSGTGEEDDTVSVYSGITAVFDTRDSRTDPSRGIRATASVTPAVTMGDIQSGYVISDASLATYRQLTPQLTVAGRVRAGSIAGASLNAVPADQSFYAGGGGSVRGFEYQSLSPRASDGSLEGGRSVVEASAELRWRSDGRWGGVVFADMGTATEQAAPELSDIRAGVGVGVRYHFDFAPLRFDIAAPLDRRSDEASLHVYVGLGQAF